MTVYRGPDSVYRRTTGQELSGLIRGRPGYWVNVDQISARVTSGATASLIVQFNQSGTASLVVDNIGVGASAIVADVVSLYVSLTAPSVTATTALTSVGTLYVGTTSTFIGATRFDNYIDLKHIAGPGGLAGYNRVFAAAGGMYYYWELGGPYKFARADAPYAVWDADTTGLSNERQILPEWNLETYTDATYFPIRDNRYITSDFWFVEANQTITSSTSWTKITAFTDDHWKTGIWDASNQWADPVTKFGESRILRVTVQIYLELCGDGPTKADAAMRLYSTKNGDEWAFDTKAEAPDLCNIKFDVLQASCVWEPQGSGDCLEVHIKQRNSSGLGRDVLAGGIIGTTTTIGSWIRLESYGLR